ncbi:MAG: hypothetical protein LBI29_02865 [Rickettsiales bacterium]|jgi:hypothetical protein|nr:hypothetical protein [Rickettsiales bacterium]
MIVRREGHLINVNVRLIDTFLETILILFGLGSPEWLKRNVEGSDSKPKKAQHYQYRFGNGENVGFFKKSSSSSGSVSGSSVGPGGFKSDKIDSVDTVHWGNIAR